MKKAIICLIALALLAGMGSCGKVEKDREHMYFASPYNEITENGKWIRTPVEVCRYTGGDGYTVAYTFPDTEDYVFTVFGDALYYMPAGEGNSITRVDLASGKEEMYAEFEYDAAYRLLADENGVYLSCSLSPAKDGFLYKITDTKTELISEHMVNSPAVKHIAIGDKGLFFAEKSGADAYGRTLKRYDTETGELKTIAETEFAIGSLDYGGGCAYVKDCGENVYDGKYYGINTKTGECRFAGKGEGCRARGGWLYYADFRFGDIEEEGFELEILRRRFDGRAVESCGKTSIPYLDAIGFEDSIEFGENGFIIYCTERKERTEYMYFKYGEYGGTRLTPQTAKN